MYGAPGRSRTCDLQFRKLTLYPTELRARDRNIISLSRQMPTAVVEKLGQRLQLAEKSEPNLAHLELPAPAQIAQELLA